MSWKPNQDKAYLKVNLFFWPVHTYHLPPASICALVWTVCHIQTHPKPASVEQSWPLKPSNSLHQCWCDILHYPECMGNAGVGWWIKYEFKLHLSTSHPGSHKSEGFTRWLMVFFFKKISFPFLSFLLILPEILDSVTSLGIFTWSNMRRKKQAGRKELVKHTTKRNQRTLHTLLCNHWPKPLLHLPYTAFPWWVWYHRMFQLILTGKMSA